MNRDKLLSDFNLPENTDLRKGVLIYSGSVPAEDFKTDENVKLLMKKLDVKLFFIGDSNMQNNN